MIWDVTILVVLMPKLREDWTLGGGWAGKGNVYERGVRCHVDCANSYGASVSRYISASLTLDRGGYLFATITSTRVE